ncbi:G-protein coupled receptor Mth2 [Glossina fuscipes]|uniref:G-protein coupled receptor Mth2 n=1 Tax=Glossina fuscipes TaxID=7396 RepID=A0A9C6DZK7_9MUSC|nr:G-protein coupled receptor Mth2 [Glossina fuscipes]
MPSMFFALIYMLYASDIQKVAGVSDFKVWVPLCCPTSWLLAKVNRGIFRLPNYKCVPPPIDRFELIDNEIAIFEDTHAIHGYGIYDVNQTLSNSSVLSCDHQTLIKLTGNENVQIPSHSCVIGLGKHIAVISCPLHDNDILQPLNFIHKCCPIGYVYEVSQQKCIVNEDDNYHVYKGYFPNFAIFNSAPLDCSTNKVLVEYKVNKLQSSFADDQFILLQPEKRKFYYSDYCLEAIMDQSNIQQKSNVSLEITSGEMQPFLVRVCDNTAICDRIPCIRRCCQDDEIFTRGNATSYCKKDTGDISYHSFESLNTSGNFTKPQIFGVLRSLDCLKYHLNPDIYPEDEHYLNNRDGSLFVWADAKQYSNNEYCIEKIHNSSLATQKLYTFLCFDTKIVGNDRLRFKVYVIGLFTSCSFYALTLLVYLSISKLRNLPGKILICLVSNLLMAYFNIAVGQLMPTANNNICFALAFFTYFCLMAAFSWMNVMCFDIWQTFGSSGGNKRSFEKDHNKRFLIYSVYGWGLPTIITVTTITLTKSNLLSESLRPNFGHGMCWFNYNVPSAANLLFFSGPLGILFLINFVLFVMTLRYCNRVKREIFRMQSSNWAKPILKRRFFMEKERFAMNTRLFIAMGITWFLELLSIVFYDRKKMIFWAVSDSFNVLLGVFVFFIFVFKKRVWHAILTKIGLRSAHSVTGTPVGTSTTHNISMKSLNLINSNAKLLHPNTAKRTPTM